MKRTRQEIDRQRAVTELRAVVRRISESGSYAEIRDLAEKLEHVAYDLSDWAERQRVGKPTGWDTIRQQRHDADEAIRAVVGE